MPTTSTVSPHLESVGRVMITNNGTHPPELWAQVAAEQIAPINPDMIGVRRRAAITLQNAIVEALEKHHGNVHKHEHENLKADPSHCEKAPSADAYIDAAMADIQAAAKGTEWEDHFTFGRAKPSWFDARQAEIDARGADHVDDLSPAQVYECKAWQREELIREEIARMIRSHQNVERQSHRDRRGAHAHP